MKLIYIIMCREVGIYKIENGDIIKCYENEEEAQRECDYYNEGNTEEDKEYYIKTQILH